MGGAHCGAGAREDGGEKVNVTPEQSSETRRARYADLLKYPEWRVFAHERKRAVGFACQMCAQGRREEGELEVHHWWYDQARWPWQYEARDVVVVCAGCHAALHAQLEAWKAVARGQWSGSEFEFGRFVTLFRKHVFPGLTKESFAALNGRLVLGVEVPSGGVSAVALRVLGRADGRRSRG